MSTSNVTNTVSTTEQAAEASKIASEFIAQVQEIADIGNGLSHEVLQAVASKLGASANDFGRPEIVRFTAYVLAMSGRNLSFQSKVALAGHANNACSKLDSKGRERAKKVFQVRAKVGALDGQASYRLNMPAQFEAVV